MKSTEYINGKKWFIEIAVLPFIRRYELRHKWYPILSGSAIGSLIIIFFLNSFHQFQSLPKWIILIPALTGLIFITFLFLITLKFPLPPKAKNKYLSLLKKGIIFNEKGMLISVFSIQEKKINWEEIEEFFITSLENSGNTEIITIRTSKENLSFPFLNLVDASRIPIPGLLKDKEKIYYCYQPNTRMPLKSENNDFYNELKKKLPEKEGARRIEKLKFQCPGCHELFNITILDWFHHNREILYCNKCPRVASVSRKDMRFTDIYNENKSKPFSIILKKENNLITFRGITGAEPDEYSYEVIKGDIEKFIKEDSRGEKFKQALEKSLKQCSCSGSFQYKSKPKCPLCNRELPELVSGIGYGNYAVITDEWKDDEVWK